MVILTAKEGVTRRPGQETLSPRPRTVLGVTSPNVNADVVTCEDRTTDRRARDTICRRRQALKPTRRKTEELARRSERDPLTARKVIHLSA
jgi:hypothetical protein